MLASKVIAKARKRITKKGAWCQKRYESGSRVCAMGALINAGGILGEYELRPVHDAIREKCNQGMTIEYFNDTHTHAEVLAMLDRALEIAVERERVGA